MPRQPIGIGYPAQYWGCCPRFEGMVSEYGFTRGVRRSRTLKLTLLRAFRRAGFLIHSAMPGAGDSWGRWARRTMALRKAGMVIPWTTTEKATVPKVITRMGSR